MMACSVLDWTWHGLRRTGGHTDSNPTCIPMSLANKASMVLEDVFCSLVPLTSLVCLSFGPNPKAVWKLHQHHFQASTCLGHILGHLLGLEIWIRYKVLPFWSFIVSSWPSLLDFLASLVPILFLSSFQYSHSSLVPVSLTS